MVSIANVFSLPIAHGATALVGNDGKFKQVTSSAATIAEEVVRMAAQGTIEEVFVQVGELVKKGQPLAHTDLYSTRLNLSIARTNYEATGTVDSNLNQFKQGELQHQHADDLYRQNKNKTTSYQLEGAALQEGVWGGQYQAHLESKNTQKIQLDYWEDEYRRRIVVAPFEGIITEVLAKPGVGVNFGTHVFTIRKKGYYAISVTAPASLADSAAKIGNLMVQGPGGGPPIQALVNSVNDDLTAPGKNKILKLLINGNDIPLKKDANPAGMKFEVFIPE